MTQSTALAPILQAREELAPMRAEFGSVLPSHISAEKFMQVCITALEVNPDLLRADRQSFKVACLNAANDGLLPDKREGAFVIFNTTVEVRVEGRAAVEKVSVPMVQWMPMITGILKKSYQTGLVSSISVEMVHKNDVYRRAAGDNAEIVHEPLDFGDRGPVVGTYAIIHMKAGGTYREVMDVKAIEKVRGVSRSKDRGPWVQFWEEMAKKTILRRMLKRVPLTPELDRVLSRDDVFYDLGAEGHARLAAPERQAIPAKMIFANKPATKRLRAPASQESASDAASLPAEDGSVGASEADSPGVDGKDSRDQSHIIDAIAAIDHAEDMTGLLEATETAARLEDVTAEEKAWIGERVDAAKARLTGAEPFRLKAMLNSTKGVQEFDEVSFWRSDILTKMAALKGDSLGAFWKKNLDHVLDAGENGFDQDAEKILEVAKAHGLPTEVET